MTRSAGLARTVGGTAAIVIVALGATARGQLHLTHTHADIHVFLLSVWAAVWTVGAVFGVLMIFGRLVGTRQARRADLPVKTVSWPTLLTSAILIGLAIRDREALGRALSQLHRSPPAQDLPATGSVATEKALAHNGGATSATFAAIAILVCLGVALLLAHRTSTPNPPPLTVEPDQEAEDAWAIAVYDGSVALADIADPRAAIIACYVAMRAALLDAGVNGQTSDTPSDMLIRIAAAGIAPDAANALTGLFLEARFSAHVIAEAQREQALTALSELATATAAHTAAPS